MAPIHGLVEATKHLSNKQLKELTSKYKYLESSHNEWTQKPKPPQYFQLLGCYKSLYRVIQQIPKEKQRKNKLLLRKIFKGRKKPISREQWNYELLLSKQLEGKLRYEIMECNKNPATDWKSIERILHEVKNDTNNRNKKQTL